MSWNQCMRTPCYHEYDFYSIMLLMTVRWDLLEHLNVCELHADILSKSATQRVHWNNADLVCSFVEINTMRITMTIRVWFTTLLMLFVLILLLWPPAIANYPHWVLIWFETVYFHTRSTEHTRAQVKCKRVGDSSFQTNICNNRKFNAIQVRGNPMQYK